MDQWLKDKLGSYQKKGYVFKSCGKEWIVVMKKRKSTKTTEGRYDVKSKIFVTSYAKFRGDKFYVIDIVNKFDKEKGTKSVNNTYYTNEVLTYTKKKMIASLRFDKDINNVCTDGIHYFLEYERAYYYDHSDIKNGIRKGWFDNDDFLPRLKPRVSLIDGSRF
jgi:hypothetical protein